MAHANREATKLSETLLLPLQFRASIRRVADTKRVGDWIVGFLPEDLGDGTDEEFLAGDQPREWEFDRLPEEWLTSYLRVVTEYSEKLRSPSPAPESVMRILIHSGTFREEDWVETEKVLKGTTSIGERIRTLPTEVREEIRRLNVRGDKQVYVLRIDDFWLEWRLLETLALLAGALSQKRSIVSARPEAERACSLLAQLNSNSSGAKPRGIPAVSSSRFLGDHVRMLIRDVVRQAFRRVLKMPETIFQYGIESGPSLTLEARSVLGVAYLVLLRNFARGWKRCKRPDCQKLFPITDDARKIFCSQYCGHLESLRKNRKAGRQIQRKMQRRKP